MSSSELSDADATIIRPASPVTQVKRDLGELGNLGKDFGKVSKGALKSLGGFRTFILRGNVVDLAIGIVIGAAFTAFVNAFVKDVITPLIPVAGASNGKDVTGLASYSWKIPHTYLVFPVGDLVNTLISFLIVAAVLYYFVVLPVNKLTEIYHPKEAEEKKTRGCPYCYQAIHVHATRCPFCTSQVTPGEKHEGGEAEQPILELPASLEGLSHQLAEKLTRKPSLSTTAQKSGGAAEENSGISGEGEAAKE